MYIILHEKKWQKQIFPYNLGKKRVILKLKLHSIFIFIA